MTYSICAYSVYMVNNNPRISEQQICLCSFYFGLSTVLNCKKNTKKCFWIIILILMVENVFFC